MKAVQAASAAEVEEKQAAEVDDVKTTEEGAREDAEDTLSTVVDGVVAAANDDVDERLQTLQVDMATQIAAMEEQMALAYQKAEAEFGGKVKELEEVLARERGEHAAEKLEHDWAQQEAKEAKLALEVAEKSAAEALAVAQERIRADVQAEAETQVTAAKAEAEAGWSELCDILGSQATEAMETGAAAERA